MPDQTPFRLLLDLPDEAATEGLARSLAPRLGAGDVLALSGPIGAGKSAFARALIAERLATVGRHEDIPSPTFTLVQVYEAGPLEIWHCDLYRLNGPEEAWELGLDEAFAAALCLVEWPDRLGDGLPDSALRVALAPGPGETERRATLSAAAGDWATRLADLSATRGAREAALPRHG